jgi:hypothetical protein
MTDETAEFNEDLSDKIGASHIAASASKYNLISNLLSPKTWEALEGRITLLTNNAWVYLGLSLTGRDIELTENIAECLEDFKTHVKKIIAAGELIQKRNENE